MKSKMLLATAALLLAVPIQAQTSAAPATVAEPSAEQLTVATRLMDVMMPPVLRDAMVTTMVDALMANLAAGVMNSGRIKTALEERPEARPVFDRFIERQRVRAQQSMRQNLPSMIDAMAMAYARQFSPVELADMEAFFATPSGQAYVVKSSTIMTDPAVAAWQQRVIASDLEHLPAEMARLREEMRAVIGDDQP